MARHAIIAIRAYEKTIDIDELDEKTRWMLNRQDALQKLVDEMEKLGPEGFARLFLDYDYMTGKAHTRATIPLIVNVNKTSPDGVMTHKNYDQIMAKRRHG